LRSSEGKIRANRANARASTGPKTTQGRSRSARNAIRHGLSLPIHCDPALSEDAEALAREIAGKDANAEIQALARRVAEAQIDLRRVRDARHQLLYQSLSDPYYDSRANTREKVKVLFQLLKPNASPVPLEALDQYLMKMPQGPQKLAVILAQEVRQLSVMDRYERRALSRRKFVIRAFDLAKSRCSL
jgi:enoyl-CoA hydratase/carnithine racemase